MKILNIDGMLVTTKSGRKLAKKITVKLEKGKAVLKVAR